MLIANDRLDIAPPMQTRQTQNCLKLFQGTGHGTRIRIAPILNLLLDSRLILRSSYVSRRIEHRPAKLFLRLKSANNYV